MTAAGLRLRRLDKMCTYTYVGRYTWMQTQKNAVRGRLSKHSFVARRLTFITDDILRRGPLTIMFIVFIVAVVVLSARPWGHSAGGRRKA